MLAKLEHGQLIPVPTSTVYDGVAISNYNMLPEETLLSHGWKPVTYEDMPPEEDGIAYRESYTDNGDSITVSWFAYEIPPPPPTVEDIARALDVILGDMDSELT